VPSKLKKAGGQPAILYRNHRTAFKQIFLNILLVDQNLPLFSIPGSSILYLQIFSKSSPNLLLISFLLILRNL